MCVCACPFACPQAAHQRNQLAGQVIAVPRSRSVASHMNWQSRETSKPAPSPRRDSSSRLSVSTCSLSDWRRDVFCKPEMTVMRSKVACSEDESPNLEAVVGDAPASARPGFDSPSPVEFREGGYGWYVARVYPLPFRVLLLVVSDAPGAGLSSPLSHC